MRRKALATSIGLSLLFLVVYGGCNWITSRRQDVGTFFFDWERAIPFLPFLILPYLSIDLFFVAAPFFCRTQRELRTLALRIIAAILVAGICFLLFPLRFAFPPPETHGALGFLFDRFRSLDAPYNLAPSLHAALGLLLFDFYFGRTQGFWRIALAGWFALMAASPLLTKQHHVIDIVTGFALAGCCFYFVRERELWQSHYPLGRLAFYYIMMAVVCGALAFVTFPFGLVLIWPTAACLLVAWAYLGRGPSVFGKRDGKLSMGRRFVLAPYLAGQWLSFFYYRRRSTRWNAITPSVWIGRKLNDLEATEAIKAGVTAVLDLSAEFSEVNPFRQVQYKNVPVLDLSAPTIAELYDMSRFIGDGVEEGIVYVHCKIGYSRSVAAVAAYLMISGVAGNAGRAVAIIQQARPAVVIRPEIRAVLVQLEEQLPRRVAA